jgi:hypothetical protein
MLEVLNVICWKATDMNDYGQGGMQYGEEI